MLGALYRYLREADPAHFQPMNANFGLVDDLPTRIRDKREKKVLMAERAVTAIREWFAHYNKRDGCRMSGANDTNESESCGLQVRPTLVGEPSCIFEKERDVSP